MAKAPKIKKKVWLDILAPTIFNNQILGKTHVSEASELKEKRLTANVMNLIGDMKKQQQLVTFRVKGVKDNKGITEIQRFHLMPASIKRLVRRNRDRIDSTFLATSKDNVAVKIKPLLITKARTSAAVRTALRHAVEKQLSAYIQQNSFENCVKNIIMGRMQGAIKNAVKNIYPLRVLEIRMFERVYGGEAIEKSTASKVAVSLEEKPEAAET